MDNMPLLSNFTWERFNNALRRGEIVFALGLISILVLLVIPMPTWILDISLAFSLMSSIIILMTVLFIMKPLEFSSFPTVLLVTTMLRLGLNVASTRLILSNGQDGTMAAGHVIHAFGKFIMGGNFVIGIIVFGILVIVNFVVITKGSGRIAEVSARFSLDSLPGKQMAIDADLSAGIISEQEAKERRKELELESNFFGAMDGAAKFVRGDAIAGLCITFINVIAGIIIGVAQMGLTLNEASHTYTLLTVGDGLVSQIPALIVSTAAAMLISKTNTEGTTNKALFDQLSAYPSALGMASFLMGFIAILPGLPFIPFMLLAVMTGYAAWKITRNREIQKKETEAAEEEKAKLESESQPAQQGALYVEPIRLELGYSLLPLLKPDGSDKGLADKITNLRKQIAQEVGFVIPTVRIQDNVQLATEEYIISIKEIETARGELKTHSLLAMDPHNQDINLPGESTHEPTFGLKAKWIDPNRKAEAEKLGCTVVDPVTVLSTHLSEVIKDNMVDLLSYEETQKLLDGLGNAHKRLLKDICPNQISTTGIQRVLQNLLQERISIRDLPTILEAIAEACTLSKDISTITEHVRARLSKQICAANADESGVLPIVTLSPEWEQIFHDSLIGEGEHKQLALAPSRLQNFITEVQKIFNAQMMKGIIPVLLTNPDARPHIRAIIERFRPSTVVLSQNEIHPRVKLKTCAEIR